MPCHVPRVGLRMQLRASFRRFKTPTQEIHSNGAGRLKPRIMIHAGFAKCGSTSIRAALLQNFSRLQKQSIFISDKHLRIARTPADLIGTPIWILEDARKNSENLTQRLTDEIAAVAIGKAGHHAILSAENLTNPGMPELFAGLDNESDLSVVFYLRPQLQWIPSAWKQWGLKQGVPLSDFVSQCIDARRPLFKLGIEAWKSTLPNARIHVRFLIPELLNGGNPAQDFFHLLGLPQENYNFENEPRNPSLDVSVLHVLSKNPHLFSGVHDNVLALALTRALPKKFRSKNVQMLSSEQEHRIEECFRDENLWLLKTYCSGTDVDRIYRTHFMPREGGTRYSSMTEIELIYRCLGIILESLASDERQPAVNNGQSPHQLVSD
jgi:hypothetical protein